MTNQEIHMSPFKIAIIKTGLFFKKHALTFVVGAASGVGGALVVQHFANKEQQNVEMEVPQEMTMQ